MKNPLISILVPLSKIGTLPKSEGLPAFVNQKYKNFEVILLPNNKSSDDKTLTRKYPWLKIIPTGKITRPAQKRNIGAKKAKGEIIAFIDDDAFPSDNWLTEAVKHFNKQKVEAVCGPGVLPKQTNFWEKAFDILLCSPFGAGVYTYRFTKGPPRYVDDYPSMNFLIKKKTFLDLGGFDNDFWPGEDSKLSEMLVHDKGGKIYYHPDILIYHHRRDNLSGFIKQHKGYGYHRGAFFAHGDKNSQKISYLIPAFLVIYVICLMLIFCVNLLFRLGLNMILLSIPLTLYILLISIQGLLFLKKTRNMMVGFLAIISLISTHLVYGLFFIKGFFVGLRKKENIY